MTALDIIISRLALLTARTIIVTAFLLARATLLTALFVLLILLAGAPFLLTSLLPATLLGAASILLVLLARILGLSTLLVSHLIVLVLISHLRILSCRPGTTVKPATLYGRSRYGVPTNVCAGQLSAALVSRAFRSVPFKPWKAELAPPHA